MTQRQRIIDGILDQMSFEEKERILVEEGFEVVIDYLEQHAKN